MWGCSRGIGLAIALRSAADGADVAMIAKTDRPHPELDGTIHAAAQQINEAGGRVLPIIGDVLARIGVDDLSRYRHADNAHDLQPDLFL